MGNEVWMMENAVYSVLSPEGFAAILWKDGTRVAEAAEVMKITAQDLKELGVIEKIIPNPSRQIKIICRPLSGKLRDEILDFLERYQDKTGEQIREERYCRFRKMGVPGQAAKGWD